jgi:hypothetical protein
MRTVHTIPIGVRRWNFAELDVAPTASPGGVRALLAGAGERRSVVFGDFAAMLEGQLAAPARLRERHKLECDVQVYEVTAPQRLAVLSAAVRKLSGSSAPLARVNGAAVQLLELSAVMKDYRPPMVQWREADVVLPGERFIQLRVADDPTVVPDPAPKTSEPAKPAAAAAPAARRTVPRKTAMKRGIPRQFTQPWEFCMTRDEAIYDMRNTIRSWFTRWRARFGRGQRLRRWRAPLYGRTALEQLWGVRPPARAYEDREIVAWAERMLSAAGYDATRCLPEWEIFWRRKGV